MILVVDNTEKHNILSVLHNLKTVGLKKQNKKKPNFNPSKGLNKSNRLFRGYYISNFWVEYSTQNWKFCIKSLLGYNPKIQLNSNWVT